MTIYIDVVLIENLIMNYIILYATGIILKLKINHIRIIIASLLGAIYSIIAYVESLKIYSNIILKIILSILIVYVAFNPQNIKKMWKEVVIFYLTSFIFGGVAFALIYVVKPQNILMRNGLFLGTYTLKTVMLGEIVSFVIIVIGKKIKTIAMIDTGNCLKEPITNTPVVVVEHTLLSECIPKQILDNLEKIIGGDFTEVDEDIKNEYISKLKLIPYSSLGKQNGMLLGLRPEDFKIINEEEEKTKNVIIGMYNKSLTKRGEYRALIGVEIL